MLALILLFTHRSKYKRYASTLKYIIKRSNYTSDVKKMLVYRYRGTRCDSSRYERKNIVTDAKTLHPPNALLYYLQLALDTENYDLCLSCTKLCNPYTPNHLTVSLTWSSSGTLSCAVLHAVPTTVSSYRPDCVHHISSFSSQKEVA